MIPTVRSASYFARVSREVANRRVMVGLAHSGISYDDAHGPPLVLLTRRSPSHLTVLLDARRALTALERCWHPPAKRPYDGGGWSGRGAQGPAAPCSTVQPHGESGITRTRTLVKRTPDSTKAQGLPGPSTSFMYYVVAGGLQ